MDLLVRLLFINFYLCLEDISTSHGVGVGVGMGVWGVGVGGEMMTQDTKYNEISDRFNVADFTDLSSPWLTSRRPQADF